MSSIKAPFLQKGDQVAVVSLSHGMLGEPFCAHSIDIGVKHLQEMGLNPVFMPNSLKGTDYLANNPQARADDLKTAMYDPQIRAIICAIGGNDGVFAIPFLLDDAEFCAYAKSHPKIFMGFSDTTVHHLMWQRLGINSFYAHTFLCDFAEKGGAMLPYTQQSIQQFFANPPQSEILSSPIWYEERTDHSEKSIGIPRIAHQETVGYEVLQGQGICRGKLLGGCVESLYSLITGDRYPEQAVINQRYQLFPTLDEWKNKILFLETSEEKITPNRLAQMLQLFKKQGIFDVINGILVGKPQDNAFYEEYKTVFQQFVRPDLPIFYNVNFGHCYPRALIPYSIELEMDLDRKTLTLLEPLFAPA